MKSHGFYDGQKIRWLFIVLILFILKKKKSLPSKKSKIEQRTDFPTIHELRIRDSEFCFKQVFPIKFLLRFPN